MWAISVFGVIGTGSWRRPEGVAVARCDSGGGDGEIIANQLYSVKYPTFSAGPHPTLRYFCP